MSLVIEGVLEADLPWTFVLIGVGLAAFVEHALKLPSLAFAVGLYLPVSLTTPILVGGGLRKAIESRYTGQRQKEKREAGVLFSSGLIAGAALIGVVIAAAIFFAEQAPWLQALVDNWTVGYEWMGPLSTPLSIVVFAGLGWVLFRVADRAGDAGA